MNGEGICKGEIKQISTLNTDSIYEINMREFKDLNNRMF